MFQVEGDDGQKVTVRGEELASCSMHDPNAKAAPDDDGQGELTNCTHGGMKIKYMRDIPGHDLEGGDRAVKLEVCIREAWLNRRSQGFTYDLESGLCWPKTQTNIKVAISKKGLVSGYVDDKVRNRFDESYWRRRWESFKCSDM